MISINVIAQNNADKNIAGEYTLSGIRETASGFILNQDSTFEFFFSYGALDRGGTGTWTKQDNKIVFNSRKTGSKDFVLLTEEHTEKDKITIRIVDANPTLRSHVYIIIKSGDNQLGAMTDSNGEVSFPNQPVETILLSLEFCPEKIFAFSNTNKGNNHFEFRIEKDIMEVFINQFSLTLLDDELEGSHPLLKEGNYHFKKN